MWQEPGTAHGSERISEAASSGSGVGASQDRGRVGFRDSRLGFSVEALQKTKSGPKPQTLRPNPLDGDLIVEQTTAAGSGLRIL